MQQHSLCIELQNFRNCDFYFFFPPESKDALFKGFLAAQSSDDDLYLVCPFFLLRSPDKEGL